jgi:hypothetical protein
MKASPDDCVEALAGALVELHQELANDLVVVVRTYMVAERHLTALDEMAGQNVAHRQARLARLHTFLKELEGELSG